MFSVQIRMLLFSLQVRVRFVCLGLLVRMFIGISQGKQRFYFELVVVMVMNVLLILMEIVMVKFLKCVVISYCSVVMKMVVIYMCVQSDRVRFQLSLLVMWFVFEKGRLVSVDNMFVIIISRLIMVRMSWVQIVLVRKICYFGCGSVSVCDQVLGVCFSCVCRVVRLIVFIGSRKKFQIVDLFMICICYMFGLLLEVVIRKLRVKIIRGGVVVIRSMSEWCSLNVFVCSRDIMVCFFLDYVLFVGRFFLVQFCLVVVYGY